MFIKLDGKIENGSTIVMNLYCMPNNLGMLFKRQKLLKRGSTSPQEKAVRREVSSILKKRHSRKN